MTMVSWLRRVIGMMFSPSTKSPTSASHDDNHPPRFWINRPDPRTLSNSYQTLLGLGCYVWSDGGFYPPYWHNLDGTADPSAVGLDAPGTSGEAQDCGLCPEGEEGDRHSPDN